MNAGGRRHRDHGSDGRRERDEDLVLFRELYKREEQRNISLLQSVDDFDTVPGPGSNPLYKMPSSKRGGVYDIFATDTEKNDFDWLKTPPMTPLFPSLEMEAINTKFHYKDPPNLQPIRTSRFAGNREDPKPIQRPKSPTARSTTSSHSNASSRSATPNPRPGSSSSSSAATRHTLGEALNLKHKPNQTIPISTRRSSRTSVPARPSISSSTSEKSYNKHQSMPVALSDDTPPNLITVPGRASSASRGRPVNPVAKPEAAKPRRQSLSPGLARGRRLPEFGDGADAGAGGSGNLLVGSRMVEKMMNARRSAAGAGAGEVNRNLKPKPPAATTTPVPGKEVAGYGRLMSRASLDLAFKHRELMKGSTDHQQKMSFVPATSTAAASNTTSSSSITSSSDEGSRIVGRKSTDHRSFIKKNEARKRFGLC